tara:strand:+ start:16303 stop:16590 length:288 start_codon:yes stop_codon:yes gene_type:complete
MNTRLPIDFDPAKDLVNQSKHGVSLANARSFEFETALTVVDDRADYGERREIAIGYVGDRLHVLVFTVRTETIRVISLRKANNREVRTYEQNTED